jgi:hypothetical protein
VCSMACGLGRSGGWCQERAVAAAEEIAALQQKLVDHDKTVSDAVACLWQLVSVALARCRSEKRAGVTRARVCAVLMSLGSAVCVRVRACARGADRRQGAAHVLRCARVHALRMCARGVGHHPCTFVRLRCNTLC